MLFIKIFVNNLFIFSVFTRLFSSFDSREMVKWSGFFFNHNSLYYLSIYFYLFVLGFVLCCWHVWSFSYNYLAFQFGLEFFFQYLLFTVYFIFYLFVGIFLESEGQKTICSSLSS